MSAIERSPTPASEVAQRRKRREWTKVEEQRLVEILAEHPDWAAVLIHNRNNERVGGANKTTIAKEIGLQLRIEGARDAKVVLQKGKSLTDRFKAWYNRMSQTGQGILQAELHANSPLLREWKSLYC